MLDGWRKHMKNIWNQRKELKKGKIMRLFSSKCLYIIKEMIKKMSNRKVKNEITFTIAKNKKIIMENESVYIQLTLVGITGQSEKLQKEAKRQKVKLIWCTKIKMFRI